MNTIDHGKNYEAKLSAWKAKMLELTRKVIARRFREGEKALHTIQDLNMPITEMSPRIEQIKNERSTEWTPQGNDIDNGFVDVRGKYALRPRLSWTGLYGKEPWPRERKHWEKI
jgi:hypothetical protein